MVRMMKNIFNIRKRGKVQEKQVTTVLKKKKDKIPIKLREEVWLTKMGRNFEGKCPTTWCSTNITVFDFETGHNVPESKGGSTTIDNLTPLCARCNRSMGSSYTFTEWCTTYKKPEEKQQRTRLQRLYHVFRNLGQFWRKH
jgi:5-methylcytosine-specific restriction endonuclease McrA